MKPICVYTVTYNRSGLLRRAIESVLSQSFPDFEYLLLDNGSTDDTLSVCREYALRDPRIKIVHFTGNSVTRGFNTALTKASASARFFIQFDDDDYAEPDMLEFLYTNALKYDADISMCGSYTTYEDGRKEPYFVYEDVHVMNKAEALEQMLRRKLFNIAPPTKLFKSSLFNAKFKDSDKRITIHDVHMTYKLFAQSEKAVAQGIPKYYFYKHGRNVTSYIQTNCLTPELLEEYLWAYEKRTRYLSKKVPEITAFARYSAWSYMLSMCNRIRALNISGCEEQYEKMLATLNKKRTEFMDSPYPAAEEKVLLEKMTRS